MPPESISSIRDFANIPIPTYDEAVGSGAASGVNADGRSANREFERDGLLGHGRGNGSSYRPPTVESARSSVDSDLQLPEINNGDESRRVFEELDYMEPEVDTSRRSPRPYHRARLRSKFSQRWSNLSATLSSLRIPSFRSLYTPVASSNPSESSSDPTNANSAWSWLTRLSPRQWFPKEYRISAATFARLCGLLVIVLLVYFLFAWDLLPGRGAGFGGARYDPESLRTFLQDHVDGSSIETFLHHVTSYDHMAGTRGDYFMAEWIAEQWKDFGFLDNVALLSYHVYLNYPGKRSVSVVAPDDRKWTAALEEDQIYRDTQQTLTFHGHGKSGTAQGHLVYANEGTRADFDYLQQQHIITNGSIALIKDRGPGHNPALQIKAAEEAGCAGVLVYADPSDTGPHSPWQPPEDLVQRGSVTLTSWVLGDPLTPGFASTKDARRVSKDSISALPRIPSLPISWKDAKHLLESLKDHGIKVADAWIHGPTGFSREWFTGNTVTNEDKNVPIIRLENNMEDEPLQKIWNLHGVIEGTETPEKKVIVGNHRDSWCFGSIDPGTSTAVMLEVVRLFGLLRENGWRPLRTIEFVSWDAEEYNLAGSTEYVEDKVDYLRQNAVAYINLNAGVSGTAFHIAGAPIWARAMQSILDRINDPDLNSTVTLLKKWRDGSGRMEGLGVGGDYAAFQHIAGTSSIDFGFRGDKDHGYPYHSCHETFEWVAKYGDPSNRYQEALVQVISLLVLDMADSPIIPFNIRDYAEGIKGYIDNLEQFTMSHFAAQHKDEAADMHKVEQATHFSTSPLHDAVELLVQNSERLHRWEDYWTSNVLGSGGFETRIFTTQRLDYNRRLAQFDTDLLDDRGIPGREQFKHVIFGPQKWDTGPETYFPGVRDMVELGEWEKAQEMVNRAAERIRIAATNLV